METKFFPIELGTAIYLFLSIGNIVFAVSYTEHWPVGIIGAVFFAVFAALRNRRIAAASTSSEGHPPTPPLLPNHEDKSRL